MSAPARYTTGLALLLLLAALAASAPADRPATGIVEGHIRDAGTNQPLAGAQVVVAGTRLGSVTDAEGRYRIDAVAAGTHELRAQLIGYTPDVRSNVRVRAGRRTTVDFALRAESLALEDIVVGDHAMSLQLRAAVQPFAARAPDYDRLARLRRNREPWNTESYDVIDENPFLAADAHPLSTFSIDVDRASYSNVRRFISTGQRPPRDAVRIEELVNYFRYAYPEPEGAQPFSVTTELTAAPWREAHRLLRIGLQARHVDMKDLPPNNLVFLIDVSGSMYPPNKLPLVRQSLRLLVEQLREQDRVAIVVYAGAAGLVLPSTSGDQKERILAAIDSLEAGGSTAGGAGLRLAYDVAGRSHIPNGNNRVILATDGDFNVGVSSDAEMVRLIEAKRGQGMFLTVLGFGMGNYKDSKLEKLAKHGDGNYAYIDDLQEARKVLVEEAGGTLLALGKDVKIQVEFNPARVRAYRLIGYENRLLAAEDFEDDTKDAGEIGAGHSVTALYEIVPVGVESDVAVRRPPGLRYREPADRSGAASSDELAFVKLRYKEPDGDVSRLIEVPVADRASGPSEDLRFAAAVAAFGMVLRESEHRGAATLERVLAWARASLGSDRGGYRAQFVELVEEAKRLELDAAPVAAAGR